MQPPSGGRSSPENGTKEKNQKIITRIGMEKRERFCGHRERVDQALKEGRKEDYNKNRNEEAKGNSQQTSEGRSSPEYGKK